jgi:23S rRNA (uridine2552-2'-O)-methyltransferase
MVRPPTGGADGGRGRAQRLKRAKSRSASSQAWLERQLNDPYVAEAKAKGYRSRAAFKLIEIDERLGLLRRGARVVDLGCAPGGWLQVASEHDVGRIVGVDLLPTPPVAGATILEGDFTEPAIQDRLTAGLDGRADVVLSDMAPNTTGHRQTDHLRIIGLIEAAAEFAERILVPGGAFVAKAFQGGETREVIARLRSRFAGVRIVKPKASRAESAEVYVVATGFRGA